MKLTARAEMGLDQSSRLTAVISFALQRRAGTQELTNRSRTSVPSMVGAVLRCAAYLGAAVAPARAQRVEILTTQCPAARPPSSDATTTGHARRSWSYPPRGIMPGWVSSQIPERRRPT